FDGATDPTLNNYSKIREAQAGLRSLPYTGIAVTMDVGNLTDVHPKDKKPVGERLAAVALNKTYGLTAVACLGPQPNYAGFTQGYEGNNYIATIKYITGTANGLTTKNNTPLAQVFFVAGSDHIFRQATASISGTTVKLIVPAGTPLPVIAARYAFTNIAMTNLQNSDGLPAEPFRTDNWTN
ncbi:MAG: sialate O-acetylesterase, partial [Mucilaginibacter sp.]